MVGTAGFTLVEAVIVIALASSAMAAAAGLLHASARAVASGELETTAARVAESTIEEWRVRSMAPLNGETRYGRDGRPAGPEGLFEVRWRAHQASASSPHLWRLWVQVSSTQMPTPVVTSVLVRRATP